MSEALPAPGIRASGAIPAPRGEYDLVRRQLEGVATWHERRRQQQDGAASGRCSREQRLDLARRRDILQEQHRAIVARTDEQLRDSARMPSCTCRARAVVVHRGAWFIDKVCAALDGSGVDVVSRLANGAEAVGVVIAEQPDLVLVEDALPMLPGEAVIREIVACAPRTVVVAQVAHDEGISAMLAAGAWAAFPRRIPPGDVAAGLLALLDRVLTPVLVSS